MGQSARLPVWSTRSSFPPMQTGHALIAAAAILVIGGGVAAYTATPRYSLGNPGAGVSVRLDRRSGDMLGCQGMDCRAIVANGRAVPPAPMPPLPPGYVLDDPVTGRPTDPAQSPEAKAAAHP